MMNYKALREEALREAACLGDLETIEHLISTGVDVNSRNPVNGWTALHWAACRGNAAVVSILLRNGADKYNVNNKFETPMTVASTDEVLTVLNEKVFNKRKIKLPITPNYLKNPPLSCPRINQFKTVLAKDSEAEQEKDLVLRLRVTEKPPVFVEIDIPGSDLTFETLKSICANELNVRPTFIWRIMKLPNTLIRHDKDVLRLENFQEIACWIKCNMVYM